MSTARNSRRLCLRILALAAGAVAAFQIAGVPSSQAAAPHTLTRAAPPAVRAGEVIACEKVDAELPNLSAWQCNSDRWGPISDFVVVTRGSNAAYFCQTGWSEGSMWLQGRDCRLIPSGD
ncbi:hypothetical protein ACFU7T_10300 [Streptomyces sp. NPDC057555]|uniref:hypothetical protein n=1 Tax=Streptomyces sp. NPDC057555 TaxID=3346166 RepID=UPI0036C67F3A